MKKNLDRIWKTILDSLYSIKFWGGIVLFLLSIVAVTVFPFLTNCDHLFVERWWYISVFVLIFILLYRFITDDKKFVKEYNIEICYWIIFLFVTSSIFVINFYETKYNWEWFVFALFPMFSGLGIWNWFDLVNKKYEYNEKVVLNNRKNFYKVVIYDALVDLFYLSFIIDNLILRVIIGGIAMIYLFCNIVRAFINIKHISKHAFGLIQDFVIAVGLSIYLIYIIPTVPGGNESLQNIILSIMAALYGGILTLVGVGWTIKNNNLERKEDDKNRVKPIIYPISSMNFDFKPDELIDIKFLNKDSNGHTYIGIIKNTDNGVLLIKKLIIGHEEYNVIQGNVLEKNRYGQIIVFDENLELENIVLCCTDVYNNSIQYKLNYSNEKKDIILIEEV